MDKDNRKIDSKAQRPKGILKRLFKFLFFSIAVCLLFVYVWLLVPVEKYAANVGSAYQLHGFSKEGLSEMWAQTRWCIGRFRGPPTDEEMIEHFERHRPEFEALVADCYKDVAVTKNYLETSHHLKESLRSLGLWGAKPEGPFLIIDRKANPFVNRGVSFYLTDHGPSPWWSPGERTSKSYVFMPESADSRNPPRDPPPTPLDHLLATGEFSLEESTDHPLPAWQCLVREIDRNWFITRCVEPYSRRWRR
jgi:hypothetical protein